MKYTLAQIAKTIGYEGKLSKPEEEVSTLLTDSRRLVNSKGVLFFALESERSGAGFISELFKKGVINFVVGRSHRVSEDVTANANVLSTNSALETLQLLAKAHRNRFKYPLIAITGSNGKTVVKEWLFQLLSPEQNIVRSPKSYNSQIGVPLSLWEMSDRNDLAIIEAGISKPDEMGRLQPLIRPDIGIFTNVGAAHDSGFTSRQQKTQEKLILFKDARALIYSPDYLPTPPPNVESFTWSFFTPADLQILEVSTHHHTSVVKGKHKGRHVSIEIPFTDKASTENALICWSTLLFLGYEQKIIKTRMALLSPIAMRMELRQATGNCSVINDSYNFDLPSLSIALDFLAQQNQHPKKSVIISDLLQSGRSEEDLYSELGMLLESRGVSKIVGIGNAISRNTDSFRSEKYFYPTTQAFLDVFDPFKFQNEAILVKGARAFNLEKISRLLDKTVHDTVLEINLNSIISNYNYYKSLVKPEVKIMAMVKAFSYGSASSEVAAVLQYHRVDYFAVAYVDEGIALRNAGIQTPILVLNPEVATFPALVTYRLEPELYSVRILKEFAAFLQSESITQYGVHLKLDTGMHRLGFVKGELDTLKTLLLSNKNIRVTAIFSHFSATEDDAFTKKQIASFTDMTDEISKWIPYPFLKHIAKTSSIEKHPNAHFDMIRLGIGLYGLGNDRPEVLQPVATLKATISQIRYVPAGDTVGYYPAEVMKTTTKIATVKIGYADGYRRLLGNRRGYMLVNGMKAPVVGNVCMDMTMIDVTDIECHETDEVIIFGELLPVSTLATLLSTNEYEVLTSISQRVKRVYTYE